MTNISHCMLAANYNVACAQRRRCFFGRAAISQEPHGRVTRARLLENVMHQQF